MIHNHVYSKESSLSDDELMRTRLASAELGYNFIIETIKAYEATANTVDLEVQVKNVGIAPFYYDLSMSCSAGSYTGFGRGLHSIMPGESKTFDFKNIDVDDLDDVSFFFDFDLHTGRG